MLTRNAHNDVVFGDIVAREELLQGRTN
jgi:hypothetical protein